MQCFYHTMFLFTPKFRHFHFSVYDSFNTRACRALLLRAIHPHLTRRPVNLSRSQAQIRKNTEETPAVMMITSMIPEVVCDIGAVRSWVKLGQMEELMPHKAIKPHISSYTIQDVDHKSPRIATIPSTTQPSTPIPTTPPSIKAQAQSTRHCDPKHLPPSTASSTCATKLLHLHNIALPFHNIHPTALAPISQHQRITTSLTHHSILSPHLTSPSVTPHP